jgi:hypothetical protein
VPANLELAFRKLAKSASEFAGCFATGSAPTFILDSLSNLESAVASRPYERPRATLNELMVEIKRSKFEAATRKAAWDFLISYADFCDELDRTRRE